MCFRFALGIAPDRVGSCEIAPAIVPGTALGIVLGTAPDRVESCEIAPAIVLETALGIVLGTAPEIAFAPVAGRDYWRFPIPKVFLDRKSPYFKNN